MIYSCIRMLPMSMAESCERPDLTRGWWLSKDLVGRVSCLCTAPVESDNIRHHCSRSGGGYTALFQTGGCDSFHSSNWNAAIDICDHFHE